VKIVRHLSQGFVGIDQPFEIAGKPCHFVLWNGKADLVVDGVFLDSKKPYLKRKGFPWWLWILLALLFVLMAVSGTGFVPIFILLLSGLYLMRLATAPSLPDQKRLLACLGLTAAAGLLTVGLIYLASAAKIDSVFFFGRGTILQSAFESKVSQAIISQDGSVSLTAPGGWQAIDKVDNLGIRLVTGKRSSDIYALVAWESKKDLAEPFDLQAYAEVIQSIVKESYSDGVWTALQPSRLGSQFSGLNWTPRSIISSCIIFIPFWKLRKDTTG
jgi:hypothetical protein